MVARAYKLKSFQSLDAHFSCYLFCKEYCLRRKLLHSYDCLIIFQFSSIYLFSLSNLITWEEIKTLAKEIHVNFKELDGLLI